MAETCGYCNEELGERPRIELLCHHIFHTHCVLHELHMDDDLRCTSCQEFLYPNEVEEEQVVVNDAGTYHADETRLSNLYDTNEAFRKDIQKYVALVRASSKPRTAFRKLAATKKAELAPLWSQIKAQHEGHYNVKKEQLLQSDEYKAFRSSDARLNRMYSLLRQRYTVNGWALRSLAGKPGCRSIRSHLHWRNSPRYIIRSALRLQLRRW